MSTGLNAGRATGLTVIEREESFTRTESEARWSREGRAAYETEREALLSEFVLFSLTGARYSNQAEHYYMRGGVFFFFPEFRFQFHCFCGAAVPCCALLRAA